MKGYCERKDRFCVFTEGEDGICKINYDCTAPDVKMNTYCMNVYLFKNGEYVASSEPMYIKMLESRAEGLLSFFKHLNDNNKDVKIEMYRV